MEKTDDGGPAFPSHESRCRECNSELDGWIGGMRLRDYFAGQALLGFCANADISRAAEAEDKTFEEVSKWHARRAFEQADLMLKARRQG